MRIDPREAARVLAIVGMLSLTACVGTKEHPTEPVRADPDDPAVDVQVPPAERGTVPPPPAREELRG